jgi:predicted RNA binding protein YcfA (HicA-like mRNA interferase family)
MPRLYSSRHIIKVLLAHGFIEVDQTGSHKKFTDGERVVIVPAPRKETPQGTFHSILRQSGLKRTDFE